MANEGKLVIYNGEGVEVTTREMTDAELADRTSVASELSVLRTKRNMLLAKTDWTALADNTMSDAMKTYRQQLRDATEGLDTVEKVQAYKFPEEVLN